MRARGLEGSGGSRRRVPTAWGLSILVALGLGAAGRVWTSPPAVPDATAEQAGTVATAATGSVVGTTVGSDDGKSQHAPATPPALDAADKNGTTTTPTPATGHRVPAGLLRLPEGTESAIAVDLSQNRMFVYRNNGGQPQLVADHFVSIGKNGGFKRVEGDEKTPVGVYFVTSWIPDDRLPELYGAGAFPVNYPNLWDKRQGRTGSGIWIHGMPRDQETRAPRSSRGCLSLNNRDLLGIVPAVETKLTPVLISDRIEWLEPAALAAARDEILASLEGWKTAWEALDTEAYLAYYADDFRSGRMNKAAWSRHKRRVNRTKSFVEVEIRDIGAYTYPSEPDLVLLDFRQSYRSSNFSSGARKRQYWRRVDGAWRIVHEGNV